MSDPSNSLLTPATDPRERIASIDVLRGVAVLGILSINIWFFAFPFDVSSNPTIWGEYFGADNVAWWTSWIAVEGSQRAIFTMLFGASVLLFTDRLASDERRSSLTKIYYRRTFWLIVFGLINGYILLWNGDILFFYGVMGLLLYFARGWSVRRLITVAFVVIVLLDLFKLAGMLAQDYYGPIAEVAQEKVERGETLGAEEQAAIDIMASMPIESTSYEELKSTVDARSAGYFSAFVPNAEETTYYYIAFGLVSLFWESLAYMMLGMALFKLRWFDASRATSLYVSLMVIGFGIGLTVNAWEQFDSIQHDYRSTFTYGTYDIGRMAMSFGYIGLVMLICKMAWLPRVRNTLSAVGKMALTNYISQSVICNVIFIGFGLFGQLRFHEIYYVVFAIWAAQLIVSPLWLKSYRYGPLEWLWRRLTYGQPVRLRLT